MEAYEIRVMGRLLTVREAALALNITEKTLRAWLSAGKVGFVKLGRATRVPESQILELIARGHHRAAV